MPGEHPVAGEGLWGTQREVPSFLYAMPVAAGRVFLEETCLVAKPALPFATLKRRLHRRLEAMGIKARPSFSFLFFSSFLFICFLNVKRRRPGSRACRLSGLENSNKKPFSLKSIVNF